MESYNGYNIEEFIDPIDFYNVINNNINKFSDEEKLIILRFFDKLVDSMEFSTTVKSRLQHHIMKKNIKLRATEIYDTKLGCNKIDILPGVVYLDRVDKNKWRFMIKDEVLLDRISSDRALKIVKDINNAFRDR